MSVCAVRWLCFIIPKPKQKGTLHTQVSYLRPHSMLNILFLTLRPLLHYRRWVFKRMWTLLQTTYYFCFIFMQRLKMNKISLIFNKINNFLTNKNPFESVENEKILWRRVFYLSYSMMFTIFYDGVNKQQMTWSFSGFFETICLVHQEQQQNNMKVKEMTLNL